MTESDLKTEELRKRWGGRIRLLRDRVGKNRDDFGDEFGVTGKTIGRYELGEIFPKTEIFYKMLRMARTNGCVWEFTGATLAEIYRAMLEDPSLLPPKGILAYLRIEVTSPTYFFDVLDLVRPHNLTLLRSGNPGENSDGEIFVYLLFTIEDESSLEALCKDIFALKPVLDVFDDYRPKEHQERSWKKVLT